MTAREVVRIERGELEYLRACRALRWHLRGELWRVAADWKTRSANASGRVGLRQRIQDALRLTMIHPDELVGWYQRRTPAPSQDGEQS